MNEEIKEYARTYIGPPKKFYPSLEAAMEPWGIDFHKEACYREQNT